VRSDKGDQRIALSILAFMSNCHHERVEVIEAALKTPMAVLLPSLKALAAADYVTIKADKKQSPGMDVIEITAIGQAYFLERVSQLEKLVDLMDDSQAQLYSHLRVQPD